MLSDRLFSDEQLPQRDRGVADRHGSATESECFTKCVDPLRQVGFRFDTPCFLDSLLDDPLNLRSVVSQGGGITDPDDSVSDPSRRAQAGTGVQLQYVTARSVGQFDRFVRVAPGEPFPGTDGPLFLFVQKLDRLPVADPEGIDRRISPVARMLMPSLRNRDERTTVIAPSDGW